MSRKKLVYGVGINDADYSVQPTNNGKRGVCKVYLTWKDMLRRCYSLAAQIHYPAYIGCSVSEEWLIFSNFRRWMLLQDYVGKQLDKDIIFPGNKVYSPETCVFVSPAVNTLLTDHAAGRGDYPQGVSLHRLTNKFRAQIRKNGSNKHIGLFNTIEDAELAYKEEKRLHILTIACCEPDIRAKQGLYRHAELLKLDAIIE